MELKNVALVGELERHDDLVDLICETFEIDRKSLLGRKKVRSACHPRMVLMYLMRARGLSFPQIGEAVKRDHSTVMHACKFVEGRPDLLEIARRIIREMGSRPGKRLDDIFHMDARERLHQQRLKHWRELCGDDLKKRVEGSVY